MDVNLIWGIINSITAGCGIVGWWKLYRYRKQNDTKANVDVMDATAATLAKYGEILNSQTLRIDALTGNVLKLNEENMRLNSATLQNTSRLNFLRSEISAQVKMKIFAEKHICHITDCKIREPALGTYGSINPDLDEDGVPDKFE